MKRSLISLLALSLFVLLTVHTTGLAQGQGQGGPEIISHRKNPHDAAAVTAGSTGTVTPPITYHNGPLINTPVMYYIWYGNWAQTNGSDNATGQQILRDFGNSIGSSPHFMINTTYGTSSFPISGSVLFGGETSVGYTKGTRLRDADILKIINTAISSGGVPFNPDGVYFLLTSSDVTASSGFCTQYCGWHTSTLYQTGPQRLRYSFVGNANRCLSACSAQTISPNSNAGVDAMVSIIAHELEEATTDPDPRSGWADSGGAENADKCAWTFGQNIQTLLSGAKYNVTLGLRNYLIQRNLKHSTAGDTCNVNLSQQ